MFHKGVADARPYTTPTKPVEIIGLFIAARLPRTMSTFLLYVILSQCISPPLTPLGSITVYTRMDCNFPVFHVIFRAQIACVAQSRRTAQNLDNGHPAFS